MKLTPNNAENLEALRKELEQYKSKLDLSLSAGNLAWWEMELPSGKVRSNENKPRMLGYEPSDFKDPHYTDYTKLIHPDDQDDAMNAMRNHLEGKANLYEVEYRVRHKKGHYIWFYDRGSVTEFHEDKSPKTVKGIVFNNTERKNAEIQLQRSEQALRKANATKDKFFSIIAHDLKNPFNSILGYGRWLEEEYERLSEEKRLYMIRSINKSSELTFQLLQELLEWARLQQGKIDFAPKLLKLPTIIQRNLDLVERQAEEKEISMEYNSSKDLKVFGDEHMVSTVLRNLLTNAIKFTAHGGHVEIHTREENAKIVVSVTDNGIGISKNDQQKLFQLDNPLKKEGTGGESGTGLGLILCKEFIEKNKGKIWLDSNPGKGSTFSFSLPNAEK